MPLSAGTRLGPYEICRALGAGGMGEVYRARDTKLGSRRRDQDPARDVRRRRRSHRALPARSQTLASLNHPNIAHIYGLEDTSAGSGRRSFARSCMELVEGDATHRRYAHRALGGAGRCRSTRRLPIAKQIADALEAAHEQGIIHRDLEAGEHQGATGRHGEGAGLRPGEGDGSRSAQGASARQATHRCRRRSRRRR